MASHSSPSTFSAGFQLLSGLLMCEMLWLLLLSPVDSQNQSNEVGALLSFKKGYSRNPQSRGINYDGTDYFVTWLQSDENPCSWFGVTCTANNTVSELDLSGWNLAPGPGPDSNYNLVVGMLGNLKDLRHLDLSYNVLKKIPDGIENLTGLTLLDISHCFLSQSADVIGRLTQLRLLDLSGNQLPSELPNLSGCRSLRFLYLQDNHFSGFKRDGDYSSLRDLVELQTLNLADNRLDSAFPNELGNLSKLVTLDLSRNNFTGSIPALPNLTNLVYLKLDSNKFTKFEKSWSLGANSSLQLLFVSLNPNLGGTIPPSITNMEHLQILNLSGNRLSGDIPSDGFSRQLEHQFTLDLSHNRLTGSIPGTVLQQSGKTTRQCASLDLSYNRLTGSIPSNPTAPYCISNLDLSYNRLNGSIPQNLLDGEVGIYDLSLQNNQLSGDIVEVFAQGAAIANLEYARLQHNLFTGDLSKLSDRDIYRNKRSESSDTKVYPFFTLLVLDVSNNDLRWSRSEKRPDPIWDFLKTFKALTEFRAGGNNFSGTSVPSTSWFVLNESVYPASTILTLDLSSSELNGGISDKLFNSSCMPYLQLLDLSNNNVNGSVPHSIFEFQGLQFLDISNNSLSGRLPSFPGDSTRYSNPANYDGNDGLCGFPLDSCPVTGRGSGGLPLWVLLVTIGGSVTLALASCSVATWRWRVYRKRHQQDADLIRMLVERDAAALMPLRDLRKATANFAESAMIGQGGFGTVYMGKLNDGTTVAMKRSKREGSEQDKEQFLNEVRVLSNVNHRNLVKLIGCCMENKIAVLVFEYVSNGTLQEHLQGKMGAARLTWKERLNIAVQTADALSYLHSAATFPIYHRDVKSANILLNDDLNAKVADFGISRLAPLQATHVSTVAVQGTMGYIDPEYYTSYQLTDRSDVYSFGVVLLELISAKPALDFSRAGEEASLVNFASKYIERGDLEGMLDPVLAETYNDLAGHGRESILNVGRLAMTCVDMRSKARPSMNEVLKELQSLWL